MIIHTMLDLHHHARLQRSRLIRLQDRSLVDGDADAVTDHLADVLEAFLFIGSLGSSVQLSRHCAGAYVVDGIAHGVVEPFVARAM